MHQIIFTQLALCIIFLIRPLFKQFKHMIHRINAVLLCSHLGCHKEEGRRRFQLLHERRCRRQAAQDEVRWRFPLLDSRWRFPSPLPAEVRYCGPTAPIGRSWRPVALFLPDALHHHRPASSPWAGGGDEARRDLPAAPEQEGEEGEQEEGGKSYMLT